MDSSRLGVGEIVAGVSALALFVVMFLPWYGADALFAGIPGTDLNAWEAFSLIDIALFLVSVVVVGLVLVRLAETTRELPAAPSWIIAIAGLVALVLILVRLTFTPDLDDNALAYEWDLGRGPGVLLGLLAAAGITYGGWRAMRP